jgi:hypothetical protein
VLKPGGRLAAWTYSFLSVAPQLGHELDAAVRWFYHEVVGPYWPAERRWVDAHYRSIPFPLSELKTPTFSNVVAWDLSAVLGYIGSWSAVQLYTQAQNHDPMPVLVERLAPLWGDPHTIRNLSWELGLRLGQRP